MGNKNDQNAPGLNILAKIGIFASFLLVAFFSLLIYSPVVETRATSSSDSNLEIETTVASVISLTTSTDDAVMGYNEPNAPQNLPSTTMSVNVSTNSAYGYTLTLEDGDDDTNMTSITEGITDVFTSKFTGQVGQDEMADNTWGYSLDGTIYSAIPVLGSPAVLKETTKKMDTAQESTNVSFGAKVGMITAGTYHDYVQFTAYVNGQGAGSDL